MAQKSSLITLFFDKYFDKCQYIYALKIADMGYTFDRISKYLWDLYKNECVSKIGNLPSDVDYTKGFVDEIMSFSAA